MAYDRRRGLLDELSPGVAADIDAWVYWLRRYARRSGYSSVSIAWKMMEAKRVGIFSYGTLVEPEMPRNVWLIDSAVGHLEPRQRKAFTTYYLRYEPIEAKARRCHCSVPEFYRRLKRARRCVGDFVELRKSQA